jgi:hypothetical protein
MAWVAACNMLMEIKSPELADCSLRKIIVKCKITVIDTDKISVGGGRRSSSIHSDGVASREDGWPPVVHYSLEFNEQRGDILFATGPRNVYFRRYVFEKKAGVGGSHGGVIRDDYRLKCLVASTQWPNRFENLSLHPSDIAQWKDSDTFKADVSQMRDKLRTQWKTLCDELVKADMLKENFPSDEYPAIQFEVQDCRENKTQPLPEIPNVKVLQNPPEPAKPKSPTQPTEEPIDF